MKYLEQLFSAQDKTAIVTGAAGGNGRAIALGLAKAGAKLILIDKDQAQLDQFVSQLASDGYNAEDYHCDLSNNDELTALIDYINSTVKQVDILVNNAGVTHTQNFFDYEDSAWHNTYLVNLFAPYKLSSTVGCLMKNNHKGGRIINITSLNAELAFPMNPAYVTFKGALKQLTKSLALELGPYGITVNNIGPGYIKTDMTRKTWQDSKKRQARADKTMLGRWGEPEDLVGAILLLSSTAASYITAQDIYIDGGWSAKGL